MKISHVGEGYVGLIAGGGKIYTDIAARFCRSEKSVQDIVGSPYDKKIVENILASGHMAALEFDYFIFAVEGYSRVTETQLVRKRMASYMIKSGREELNGKREFSVVLPEKVCEYAAGVWVQPCGENERGMVITGEQLMSMCEQFYNSAVVAGIAEEEARYIKPQATEFKGILGLNAHALRDFFAQRCCFRAQEEIRDMAYKMLDLANEAAPDLFVGAGAKCRQLGYCPEKKQCTQMAGKMPKKETVMQLIKEHYNR